MEVRLLQISTTIILLIIHINSLNNLFNYFGMQSSFSMKRDNNPYIFFNIYPVTSFTSS